MRKLILTICLLLLCSPAGAVNFNDDVNCMGSWAMTANGGNETDLSGEGETLTETGGTLPTSADVPTGYAGTSRDFELDETEWLAHADGGSTDISGANQSISYVAWIKIEAFTTGNTVMSKYNAIAMSQMSVLLYLSGPSDAEISLAACISSDGGSGGRTCTSTGTYITVGAWTHVALVYNDTDIRLYLNGALANDPPAAHTAGLFNSTQEFRIGNRASDSDYFDGLIDEAAVFNDALSVAEVLAIKTCGMSGSLCNRRVILIQ